MAARKRATKRKPAAAVKRRRGASARKTNSTAAVNFLVPLVFIIGILFCLGFLMFMGYRTVTASGFFDVKQIDVRGINRASKEEIEKMVRRQTEKFGVWNADLDEIRSDVEKLSTIKSAAVSRVLPDGVRVNVKERIPVAVVQTGAGNFWADDEGALFDAVKKDEEQPPFVMTGWDENKTDRAIKDNRKRVEVYQKMLEEWQDFELAKRVKSVDLTDWQSPKAFVQDSDETVTFYLPKENFGKRLLKGLEIIKGRGKEIESVNLNGQKEILGFRVK